MCQSPDDDRSPWDFLQELKQRAQERRRADLKKKGGGRPAPEERRRRMLTYACSTSSKNDYVGYSGPAGGMNGKNYGKSYTQEQLNGRRLRLQQAGVNPTADPAQLGRPTCNCGEAAALSIALSYGEDVGKLMFFSFHSNGSLIAPCENCMTWVKEKSAGYWAKGTIQSNCECEKKRKRDDEGEGGGGGTGISDHAGKRVKVT
jgi:hypothetical protein